MKLVTEAKFTINISQKLRIDLLGFVLFSHSPLFLYFKKNETIMSPEHEKSNNELIKKYSKLLDDLATDD